MRLNTLESPLRRALLLSAAVHFLLFSVGDVSLQWSGRESGAFAKVLQVVRIDSGRQGSSVALVTPAETTKLRQLGQQGRVPVMAISERGADLSAATAPQAHGIETAIDASIGSRPDVIPSTATSSEVATSASAEIPEVSASALNGYRMALATGAKRFRFYPPVAQEMGVGGRADVEVVFFASLLPELRIKKTSGYDSLDKAALEMLRRSTSSIEVPSELKGRRFSFTLPIEFIPQN